MLSGIIDTARKLLNDSNYPYRWDDTVVMHWVNAAVYDIIKRRPDVLVDSNGDLQTYTALSETAPFTLTESGDTANILSGYEHVDGVKRSVTPVLYFKATSATVIRAYGSTADRTANAHGLLEITGCNSTGAKTITALNNSGIGGELVVDNAAVSGNTWSLTYTDPTMMISDIFDLAIAYYVASKALEQDSSDTNNLNRAQYFYKAYLERVLQ